MEQSTKKKNRNPSFQSFQKNPKSVGNPPCQLSSWDFEATKALGQGARTRCGLKLTTPVFTPAGVASEWEGALGLARLTGVPVGAQNAALLGFSVELLSPPFS